MHLARPHSKDGGGREQRRQQWSHRNLERLHSIPRGSKTATVLVICMGASIRLSTNGKAIALGGAGISHVERGVPRLAACYRSKREGDPKGLFHERHPRPAIRKQGGGAHLGRGSSQRIPPSGMHSSRLTEAGFSCFTEGTHHWMGQGASKLKRPSETVPRHKHPGSVNSVALFIKRRTDSSTFAQASISRRGTRCRLVIKDLVG
jgi:hypothetical protein